jgi:hypothetical protein
LVAYACVQLKAVICTAGKMGKFDLVALWYLHTLYKTKNKSDGFYALYNMKWITNSESVE